MNTTIYMLGVPYSHSILFDTHVWSEAFAKYSFVGLDFTTITAVLGHVDRGSGGRTRFYVYMDGARRHTYDVYTNMVPREIELDIEGVNVLEFRLGASGLNNTDVRFRAGLGNIIII